MCEQCQQHEDIRDRLSFNLSIMEACVQGATDNINQFDPNSDVSNGLVFAFMDLKDLVNEAIQRIDNKP